MKMLPVMKNFLKEDSGQTTTEYFLILAVVVTIFMQFRTKLLGMLNKLFTGIDKNVESAFDNQGSAQ